jgi:tRNA U38,U39,U40 pseudouridine synthase TruA
MYPSRNAIFRHLKDTNGACLSPKDHADFVKYVRNRDRNKVLLLYGYLPSKEYLQLDLPDTTTTEQQQRQQGKLIRNGDDAAQVLLEVVEQVTLGDTADEEVVAADTTDNNALINSNKITLINRSYGSKSRNAECVAQDDGTGAITEILTVKLPSLIGSEEEHMVKEWIDQINRALQERLSDTTAHIRLLSRVDMPHKKFNAEMDVTHRRVDYLLPADFLFHDHLSHAPSRLDFLNTFEPFGAGRNPYPNNNNKKGKGGSDDPQASTNNAGHPEEPSTDTATATNTDTDTDTSRDTQTIFYLYSIKKMMQRLTTPIIELDMEDASAVMEKDFHKQKRKRNRSSHQQQQSKKPQQQQSKHHEDEKVDEKTTETPATTTSTHKGDQDHETTQLPPSPQEKRSRRKHAPTYKKESAADSAIEPATSTISTSKKGKNVLRRRRFHNFTPRVMAHEFLAYRRMDRLHHRATYRLPLSPQSECRKAMNDSPLHPPQQPSSYPFVVLSMSGDMFLTGQACRVVGLLIALVRGLVDVEIIDCIFDESFPHLVPVPPAPSMGVLASEASYMTWEGRSQLILTPRRCDRYQKGFNQPSTLRNVEEWQKQAHEHIAKAWLDLGVDDDGRITADRVWTETVLEPWAKRAREQLEEYRAWKLTSQDVTTSATTSPIEAHPGATADAQSQLDSEHATMETTSMTAAMPSLSSIDTSVPQLYLKVLECLRKADASGLWPTTTLKRQLVMVTTPKDGGSGGDGASSNNESLMVAHMKAKLNKAERSSAYAYVEGEGGASGSFSVGAMPGEQCLQPKGNKLFPELMKAAFELEMALCPHRPPSSTIAINRNAQFRPHTDSGAGAGQSTSLIVGLGDYAGGELVVEGQKMDIRYQPVEFNGWKQRHWTMPFQGERYTLVWFTPKGCENVRGIDLCNS